MTRPQFATEAVGILSEIGTLLERDQDGFRSNMSAKLADAVKSQSPDLAKSYCGVDWWGGSGSMADYIPDDPAAKAPYMRLLIRLVRVFEAAGFRCERARSWTDIFENWLERGIISD